MPADLWNKHSRKTVDLWAFRGIGHAGQVNQNSRSFFASASALSGAAPIHSPHGAG
jgi:hypothetical protein